MFDTPRKMFGADHGLCKKYLFSFLVDKFCALKLANGKLVKNEVVSVFLVEKNARVSWMVEA